MRPLLLCLLAFVLLAPLPPAGAAEPFFRKGDVIALVGGEDMVVASEYGYLELLLTRALPDYHLRFRNLAWEGDTVFEQRRDLNFPSYEEQLDKIGATVVIAQFGQMESLAGKEKLPEFIAAYEKLIERFSGGGKRRIAVVTPMMFDPVISHELPEFVSNKPRFRLNLPDAEARNAVLQNYGAAIVQMTQNRGWHPVDFLVRERQGAIDMVRTRDGIHVAETYGWFAAAAWLARLPLEEKTTKAPGYDIPSAEVLEAERRFNERLRQLIIAKNRLWFDYWRPQNWAFLAGDRTAQPSSRDHLDPSKRWFPPEREAFLPLLEAKEKEIDALAAQLAAGNAGK